MYCSLTCAWCAEHHGGEIIDGVDAGRGDLEGFLGCSHVGEQVGDVAIFHARMHQQQCRRHADQPDRGDVLARIVADVGEQVRTCRHRGGVGQQDGVAVGRAFKDRAGCDRAAAAQRPVLHHDLLAERRAHAVGDRARHDVVGAARRQRNHQRDRPVGIVALRCGRRDKRGLRGHSDGNGECATCDVDRHRQVPPALDRLPAVGVFRPVRRVILSLIPRDR